MGQKIVVGPLDKGLTKNVLPFNIDNNSFPVMVNMYQWRGRVKRKRGTSLITRLRRYFNSLSTAYTSGPTTITLNGSGVGNIFTGFGLETNGELFIGSLVVTGTLGMYTDNGDGTLSPSGTIEYGTGVLTIPAEAGNAVSAVFNYYPKLPALGIRDVEVLNSQWIGSLGFDTKKAYNIITVRPYTAYDVSFYKNPPVSAALPGYVPKTVWTPTSWNGQDYQQYWSVNYQNAFWVTNGVNVPFAITNIGMQFKTITGLTFVAGPPAVVTLTIVGHGLVIGDFVYLNEVVGNTGVNNQTGYVTAVTNANTIVVTLPDATVGGAYVSGGIAQYLTNRSDTTKDCLRWYDGDPTNGNQNTPGFTQGFGWVNFCPPLSNQNYSISDLPKAQYYLVGAKVIQNFKDRLLFLGAVVQTSSGSPIYLKDTVVYSQNGTPYYTSSYTNSPNPAVDSPASPTNQFNPILLPVNQTATAPAWFEDVTGFGGFISPGLQQPIISVSSNQDVLIVGFPTNETRIVYSGNDLNPFDFFLISSELGTTSTFSAVNMGEGVITKGSRGYVLTSQVDTDRIDLEIPDEVFQVKLNQNGNERFTAQRDFINEWIYFTYPASSTYHRFNSHTLQYNYRDRSWAKFYENYTCYGIFRKVQGFIWATVGLTYPSWNAWNKPWNAGSESNLKPTIVGGNQQGFIIERDEGTAESFSISIQSILGNVVTSPDHCLSNGDYIIIDNCIGSVSAQLNNKIFSVQSVTTTTFQLSNDVDALAGEYIGGGLIKKIYVPFLQTKQFPAAWANMQKTRLGVQMYLLTTTVKSQIQLQIYLSQNSTSFYNDGPIIPMPLTRNKSLVYSTVLYTCPESTNLGLTPANVNLQMPTANNQEQIWHRMNTSLIGDTVQLGFSMSDEQLRALYPSGVAFPVTAMTNAYPTVFDSTAQFPMNQLVVLSGLVGPTELNGMTVNVLSSTSTTVTVDVDSSTFGLYQEGGFISPVARYNQFAEIELHGFALDVSPSQLLA